MKIALDPMMTPTGLGIAFGNKQVFVITGCCIRRVEMLHAEGRYACELCAQTIHSDFTYSEWLTHIDLLNHYRDDELSVQGEDIIRWISEWTGIGQENIDCEIKIEEEAV